MPVKLIAWAILLLFCASGCKEVIDYDRKSVDEALVVSGILEAGKPVDLRLSKTVNRFSSSGSTAVGQKEVRWFENGTLKGNLNYQGNGKFDGQTWIPKEGNVYSIEILSNGNVEADASTKVPVRVPVISLDTTVVMNGKEKRMLLKLRFNDPAETENYYRIEIVEDRYIPYQAFRNNWRVKILRLYRQVDTNSHWLLKGMGLTGESEVVNGYPDNWFAVFADRQIAGKSYEIAVESEMVSKDTILASRMVVRLQSLSPEYFNYLRTVMLQSHSLANPFNEPVKIYSNINNGVGIFGSFSQASDSIIFLNQPLIESLFPGTVFRL